MALRSWKVKHADEVWGADGEKIVPAVLAAAVAEHEGEARYTIYDKPYTVRARDAQSVWDYFGTEIDPHGDRVIQHWEYDAPPPSDIIP
jgi:hypothetical protein